MHDNEGPMEPIWGKLVEVDSWSSLQSASTLSTDRQDSPSAPTPVGKYLAYL